MKNVAGFQSFFFNVLEFSIECLEVLSALGTMDCQMEGCAALGNDSVAVERRRCGGLITVRGTNGP